MIAQQSLSAERKKPRPLKSPLAIKNNNKNEISRKQYRSEFEEVVY
jgi:hypothetical protein